MPCFTATSATAFATAGATRCLLYTSLVLDGATYGYQYQKVTNSDEYIDMINPGIEKTIKLYFDVPSDKANSKDFKFLIAKGMLESGPDEQYVILN